jgi:beta-phosphoglucomutase-like phosphatase (HAD superfamily)
MENKRAIIWDNDGVLVDTEKLFFQANRLELAAIGVTATWAQFEEINQQHGVSLLSLSNLEGKDLRALYSRRDARYSELLRTEQLAIPAILELLERMKEHFLHHRNRDRVAPRAFRHYPRKIRHARTR